MSNKATQVYIDDSLIQIIKNIQKKLQKDWDDPSFTFVRASKALAMDYMGIDYIKHTNRSKKKIRQNQ